MSSYIYPSFGTVDSDADIAAYGRVNSLITIPFLSEFYLFKSLFVFLVLSCRDIITIPYILIAKIENTPEYKALLYNFISFICAFLLFILPFGFRLETCVAIIRDQKFYKVWAIYTILFIVHKILMRANKYTHRFIRGAIRSESSPILAIVYRAITINFYFWYIALNVGCYLSALTGKPGLFLSACVHIQAIILKKTLPKLADPNLIITESISRSIVIVSILHHLSTGVYSEIKDMAIYEIGCALVRYFLTALTDDGSKLYDTITKLSSEAVDLFIKNDSSPEKSLFTNYPHEGFSVAFLCLFLQGSLQYRLTILAIIVIFAFCGELILAKRVIIFNFKLKKNEIVLKEKSNDKADKKKDGDEKASEKKKSKDE